MRTSEDIALHIQQSEATKRRKAMISIRYIPASDYASENKAESSFCCTVQPNAKNNFTLPEVVKCPSSHIAYHEQVSSKQSRVTGLHFLLIGHNISRNFSAYSCCVTSVEFHGHLSFTKPAFEIMSQLKSLESVHFVIGSPSQLPFFYEPYNENVSSVPQNCNVKRLTIKVDINNYKTSQATTKSVFQEITISVLKRAGHCFPYLENFYMEIPCTGTLAKLTEKLIDTKWKSLKGKLMTSYCPFAEALFVVPHRKSECDFGESNDLDLELLDILIGRPYTAQSSYAYGVPNPFYSPQMNNVGSAVYYGRNYARFFPVERPRAPAPAPVAVQLVRNDHVDDRGRQERILQILRQQNILGGNNNRVHPVRNPQLAVRQHRPGLPAVVDFPNQNPQVPGRRLHHNFRHYPFGEDEHDNDV